MSWYGLFGTFTGVAFLTVVAVPLAALVVVALAQWRRASGTPRSGAWRTALADVGMVYGTVPWVWMTMMPGSHAGDVLGRVSLVPFRDLVSMGSLGIVGNLLVLSALGFFAPLRIAPLASWPRVLLFAASCSLLIEVAQFVLLLDRVSSVDDVLLNTAGAGLAAWLSRPWWLTPGEATVVEERGTNACPEEPRDEASRRVSKPPTVAGR
ncbi:VanZ family protein [Nocardioides sp. Root151]|uniref:VanZ family protein n=1 Tax=Nocardioides sp. Root151 TaxID=1736475 RepID=UPI0007034D42|nr:VanZ family protein [Nocardioides sp. Root151]KQZ68861.1 teicoplanin resistance protein VanZ [Nocardioides sp. Root151]